MPYDDPQATAIGRHTTTKRLQPSNESAAAQGHRALKTRLIWLAVLLFLGILAIAAHWYPVQRIFQAKRHKLQRGLEYLPR